ncbi:MAG: hypothetical protein K0U20_09440 [Proteobacteria bacterium]|nr:hypothetical protein [Pseudomonadota bacterium]MCH9735804.1 hypothetical protein [Actinomycetes bacterium]
MAFGQLNLTKTVAPQQTVSTSALANLMQQRDKALQNVGQGITQLGEQAGEYGRQRNTSELTDLIARSPIAELDADGIRTLTGEEGIDTSRLTKEGTDEFNRLLQGKDAFAKQGTGVILKDGTFRDLAGQEGVVPEQVRTPEFYMGFKSGDKTFDRSLEGQTLEDKKALIDGYMDGQTRAKELFRDDKNGKPVHDGFVFIHQGKPITALELRQKIGKNQTIIDDPTQTPLKKEKAQQENDELTQTTSQVNKPTIGQMNQQPQLTNTEMMNQSLLPPELQTPRKIPVTSTPIETGIGGLINRSLPIDVVLEQQELSPQQLEQANQTANTNVAEKLTKKQTEETKKQINTLQTLFARTGDERYLQGLNNLQALLQGNPNNPPQGKSTSRP